MQKLVPIFVHYGLRDGASAIYRIKLNDKNEHFLVGGNNGKCLLYSLESFKMITCLYEDKETRQIVSLGKWSQNAENLAGTSSPTFKIWIHFRGSCVEIFDWNIPNNNLETSKFVLIKKIPTSHYGFCKAVEDWNNSRFILPDYENESTSIQFIGKSSNKNFLLTEDFLVKSFIKRNKLRKTEPILNEKTILELKLFKGMIMNIKTNIDSEEGDKNFYRILMAFEDSTIAIFDTRTKEVIDCIKHPKHQEFLDLAVKRNSLKNLTQIAISVIGQIFLLEYDFSREIINTICVIRRSKNLKCTSLSFNGATKEGTSRLACGFNNGIIEIYCMDSHCGDIGAPQIEYSTNLHEDSILCLNFETTNNSDSEKADLTLIAASSDGTLGIYKL